VLLVAVSASASATVVCNAMQSCTAEVALLALHALMEVTSVSPSTGASPAHEVRGQIAEQLMAASPTLPAVVCALAWDACQIATIHGTAGSTGTWTASDSMRDMACSGQWESGAWASGSTTECSSRSVVLAALGVLTAVWAATMASSESSEAVCCSLLFTPLRVTSAAFESGDRVVGGGDVDGASTPVHTTKQSKLVHHVLLSYDAQCQQAVLGLLHTIVTSVLSQVSLLYMPLLLTQAQPSHACL
jgi:hypothetical protein